MRKVWLLILFVLLIPSGALAQGKTLNDICEDMLFLMETYTACVSQESVCTEDDALALKAGAENTLRDLVVLVRSGTAGQMILTVRQAQLLNEKIHIVRERLVKITAFNAGCNLAIFCMGVATTVLHTGVQALAYVALIISVVIMNACIPCALVIFLPVFVVIVAAFFFVGAVSFLSALLLSPACLFWWL